MKVPNLKSRVPNLVEKSWRALRESNPSCKIEKTDEPYGKQLVASPNLRFRPHAGSMTYGDARLPFGTVSV